MSAVTLYQLFFSCFFFSVIWQSSQAKPPQQCPLYEIQVPCMNRCLRCEYKNVNCNQTADCTPGCDCVPGFLRNQKNVCIPSPSCPATGPTPSSCPGPNEVQVPCVDSCQRCEYINKECFQVLMCTPGCNCAPGFYRNDQEVCVPAAFCPRVTCGPNEEYSDCGSSCPPTCGGRTDIACPAVCVKGCFCKEGFIREPKSGICIPKSQCRPTIPTCGPNEVYSDCGSACPPTCGGRTDIACIAVCVKGCFCREGFIRDSKSGLCIPKSLCRPTIPTCGPNEVYSDCGSSCPPTCGGRTDIACPAVCAKGCFCKEGFIREPKSGLCIPRSLCRPKICGPTEVYTYCVNICNTCQNRNTTCNFLVCNDGCDCALGYTRSDEGICIPENQCPSVCGPNEEHSPCVNPCNNCELKGNCQFLACNPGCDCIPKYRRHLGICIPESQCPPVCPRINCREGCHMNPHHKPCPRCVCPKGY